MKPWALIFCLAFGAAALAQQPAAIVEAETRKCEDRVGSVRREVMNRYEVALDELQLNFQKAADLEGALMIRTEHQRAAKAGMLEEADFRNDLPALRALQGQTSAKLQELTSHLIAESVTRLQELKRSYTISGSLDEAVAARSAIERLQTRFLPISRPDVNLPMEVSTLLRLFTADRERTDKAYQNQRVALRGTVAGYKQDPADLRHYVVYLAENGGPGWVQCTLAAEDFRFREEKQFNSSALLVVAKGTENPPLRIQRGVALELVGTCQGWGEPVRFVKCTFPR